LNGLLTDRDGVLRDTSLAYKGLQERHVEDLRIAQGHEAGGHRGMFRAPNLKRASASQLLFGFDLPLTELRHFLSIAANRRYTTDVDGSSWCRRNRARLRWYWRSDGGRSGSLRPGDMRSGGKA
jgi:hypothetical protein